MKEILIMSKVLVLSRKRGKTDSMCRLKITMTMYNCHAIISLETRLKTGKNSTFVTDDICTNPISSSSSCCFLTFLNVHQVLVSPEISSNISPDLQLKRVELNFATYNSPRLSSALKIEYNTIKTNAMR